MLYLPTAWPGNPPAIPAPPAPMPLLHPASLPAGEYWDTMIYEFDGTPSPNQDAHRQKIVDWVTAAGGLCTAFDMTLKGIMHAGAAAAAPGWLADTGRKAGWLPVWLAGRPSRPPPLLQCLTAASTGGCVTARASRRPCWGSGPRGR